MVIRVLEVELALVADRIENVILHVPGSRENLGPLPSLLEVPSQKLIDCRPVRLESGIVAPRLEHLALFLEFSFGRWKLRREIPEFLDRRIGVRYLDHDLDRAADERPQLRQGQRFGVDRLADADRGHEMLLPSQSNRRLGSPLTRPEPRTASPSRPVATGVAERRSP